MQGDIAKIYALERAILDMDAEEAILKESVAQGQYDLRNAKSAVMEYEGSLRSFLDRLRGIREARAEQLHRSLRHAQSALSDDQRRQEALRQNRIHLQSQRAQYPALADIPECREKSEQEAHLSIAVLETMLDRTQEAMLACRDLEQGRRMGELISADERQQILTMPVTLGMDCGLWLKRLETALSGLEIPFAIPAFFQNPAAYLAVTQHTRRDRLNGAMDQTLQLKKQITQLKNIIEA